MYPKDSRAVWNRRSTSIYSSRTSLCAMHLFSAWSFWELIGMYLSRIHCFIWSGWIVGKRFLYLPSLGSSLHCCRWCTSNLGWIFIDSFLPTLPLSWRLRFLLSPMQKSSEYFKSKLEDGKIYTTATRRILLRKELWNGRRWLKLLWSCWWYFWLASFHRVFVFTL